MSELCDALKSDTLILKETKFYRNSEAVGIMVEGGNKWITVVEKASKNAHRILTEGLVAQFPESGPNISSYLPHLHSI